MGSIKSWRHRRRPDGQRHRPCLRPRRLRASSSTILPPSGSDRPATINGNLARQVSLRQDHRKQNATQRSSPGSRRPMPFAISPACDLVIEAATEDETVKRKIFAELCPVLKPEAMLATNTSSISITRLASVDRPAGALHRHPLHEPGAGDEAGRTGPRHRHRGRRPSRRPRPSSPRSARRSPSPRISPPSSSTASCCR